MSVAKIVRERLWTRNPVLVHLLGLCPLLAISDSLVKGLSLGLATVCVLGPSTTLAAMIHGWVRPHISPHIRSAVDVLLVASLVAMIEMAMNAWFNALHARLGLFLPLIAGHCLLILRAQAPATHQRLPRAAFEGLMTGLGFTAVFALLGALRELLGQGTLGDGLHLLLGEALSGATLRIGDGSHGLLIAALPPGAFIALGLLIALKNAIDARHRLSTVPRAATPR